jgi:Flp pilus assembly protein TadG
MKGQAMHTQPSLHATSGAKLRKVLAIRQHASKQKGAVTLLVALTLPILIGAAALAVDMAHLHVVRNELQNDADAAALAGARVLYNSTTGSTDWSLAQAQAQAAIALNRATGIQLTEGRVQTGYWNLTGSATSLQGLPMTPTVNDAPAVQVTVRKAEGQNSGPVRTFLAGILGTSTVPLQATAVAGVTSPGRASLTFPVAMSQCMYQKFWNMSAQPPAPVNDPKTGKPYVFKIGSLYHYDNCDSGQWTALNFSGKGANTIDQILAHDQELFDPPPPMLSIGDTVFMDSGSKTSLYKAVEQCIKAKEYPCNTVVMPVLDQVVAGTNATITGFACLKILGAVGGNQKFIEVQMSNTCPPIPSGGVGPNYGVISPPSLFK